MSQALLYSDAISASAITEAHGAVQREEPALELHLLAPNVAVEQRESPVPRLDADGAARLEFELLIGHMQSRTAQLPDFLVDAALARGTRSIRRWHPEQGLVPYVPYEAQKARVLNLFPGHLFPLRMGSQRRAIELTWHLNRHGLYTDLLVMNPNTGTAELEVLKAIAPRVFGYESDRRKLPAVKKARRQLERQLRSIRGVRRTPPELFSERLHLRSNRHALERLCELLEEERYEAVIVNYAWQAGIVAGVPERLRNKVRWICDTHDVQYVRAATANRVELRVGVNLARERRAEVEALRHFDTLLAISESDGEELRKCADPERVLLVPTGFDYAQAKIEAIPDLEAPRCGFIGGPMDANAAALKVVVEQWWPRILERWPRATLKVAGAIGKRNDVRDFCFLEPGVELLGFVPSLSDYYASIDVSLGPVLVQGGLNFKSVESIMAGVLLVTTSLGKVCLGQDAPVIAANTADEVVASLERGLDATGAEEIRTEAQRWAIERFGSEATYAPLRELIGRG